MDHPEQFGRYELRRRIARGDVSEVFLARIPDVQGASGLAVVRRVLKGRERDAEFIREFLREGELAARLDHPNLVHIDDVGEIDGRYFIATEYLPGGSLAQLMERRGDRMPLEAALFVVGEVCAGLQFAHALAGPDGAPLGAVHADLGPKNVIVTIDGMVKVVDFGLAKAWARLGAPPPADRPGAFAHLAPELARGESVERRTDVYGCGALLYFLVTGQPAFPRAVDAESAAARPAPPLPPREHAKDLPEEVEAIILRAMALEPRDRFPTCGAMRRRMDEVADALWLSCSGDALAPLVRLAFPEVLDLAAERLSIPDVPEVAGSAPPPAAPAPESEVTLAEPEPTPGVAVRIAGVSMTGLPPGPAPLTLVQAPEVVAATPARQEVAAAEGLGAELRTEPRSAPAPWEFPAGPVAGWEETGRPRSRRGLVIAAVVVLVLIVLGCAGVAAFALLRRADRETAAPAYFGVLAAPRSVDVPTGVPQVGDPRPAGLASGGGADPGPAAEVKPPDEEVRAGEPGSTTPAPGSGNPTAVAGVGTSPPPQQALPAERAGRSERVEEQPLLPRREPPDAAVPGREPDEVRAEGTGFLTVLTRPASRVYMDSRLLGMTPIVRREVPAGRHKLRLVDPAAPGGSKLLPVTVRRGELTQVQQSL